VTARLKLVLIIALAALYPFHRSMAGFNVSLGDFVVALIFVPILLGLAIGRLHLPRYVMHALAFLGVTVVAFFANVHQEGVYFSVAGGTKEMLKFAAAVSWMVAMFWLLRDDLWNRLLVFAMVTVTIGTAFASWSIVENIVLRIGRPTGPFENPNIYGNYLVFNAVLLGIAMTLIREGAVEPATGARRRLLRLFLSARLVFLPVLLLGLLATGSRGSILAGLTALFVSTRLRLPRRVNLNKIAMGLIGLLIVIGSVTWFLRQDPHILRRIQGASRGEGPNTQERLVLWDASIRTFVAQPVVGVGYGQFPYYSSVKFGLDPHVTHQTYLSIAAETGIVGLLVMAWLVATVLRDTRQSQRGLQSRVPLLCRAFLLGTCVQGLVANVDQFRSPWLIVGVVAALGLELRRQYAPGSIRPTRDDRRIVGPDLDPQLASVSPRPARGRRRF